MNESLVILLFLPLWLLPAWIKRYNGSKWKVVMAVCAFVYLFSAAATLLYLMGMSPVVLVGKGWGNVLVALVMLASRVDGVGIGTIVYVLDAPGLWEWLALAMAPAWAAWEVGTKTRSRARPGAG